MKSGLKRSRMTKKIIIINVKEKSVSCVFLNVCKQPRRDTALAVS